MPTAATATIIPLTVNRARGKGMAGGSLGQAGRGDGDAQLRRRISRIATAAAVQAMTTATTMDTSHAARKPAPALLAATSTAFADTMPRPMGSQVVSPATIGDGFSRTCCV